MNRSGRLTALACRIALCAFASGCQPTVTEPVRRPGVKSDACAERLHDVCGPLLLYHSTHGRLPGALEELGSVDRVALPPLVCPTSGKAYVYNPGGIAIRDVPGRLVLYDAEASHMGMRWGILVRTPGGGRVDVRVVLTAEEDLRFGGE